MVIVLGNDALRRAAAAIDADRCGGHREGGGRQERRITHTSSFFSTQQKSVWSELCRGHTHTISIIELISSGAHRVSTYKASLVHHRRQQQQQQQRRRHLAPSNLVAFVIRNESQQYCPVQSKSLASLGLSMQIGQAAKCNVCAACHVQIVCQPRSYCTGTLRQL